MKIVPILVFFVISYTLADWGSAQAEPLQGGIKSDNEIKPSLTVLTGESKKDVSLKPPLQGSLDHNYLQSSTSVIQISGNKYLNGGPTLQSGTNQSFLNIQVPSTSYGPIRTYGSGVIAPIVTSHQETSTQTYRVPEQVSTPGRSGAVTDYGSPKPSPTLAVSSVSGVTTYVPGFEVKTVTRPSNLMTVYHCIHGNLPFLCPGHHIIEPGYKAEYNQYSPDQIRGFDSKNGTPTTVVEQNKVKPYSSREGIVTWAPGYEVTVTVPHTVNDSLGGKWTTNMTALGATAKGGNFRLPVDTNPVFVNMQRVPEEETATTLMLPALEKAAVAVSPNWGQWYKDVAKAIYSRWQYADVGIGTAVVQVKVNQVHDLQAQVVDFRAAPDVARNVKIETQFREAALKAANSVKYYDIPGFPAGSNQKEVTFNIELKRAADGPGGFRVVKGDEEESNTTSSISTPRQGEGVKKVSDWEL
ncbi:MAG: hypothetical protein K2Y32_12230 [Candidatus Obscuribacterales bacterium]|nr:hypothetical protein [Candidatus Obscuribacterales bacterium]